MKIQFEEGTQTIANILTTFEGDLIDVTSIRFGTGFAVKSPPDANTPSENVIFTTDDNTHHFSFSVGYNAGSGGYIAFVANYDNTTVAGGTLANYDLYGDDIFNHEFTCLFLQDGTYLYMGIIGEFANAYVDNSHVLVRQTLLLSELSNYITNDPYADAGNSETGGGDGTFDGSSDPVDIPPLPTVGATDAGFITLFAPTPSQLKALASYMWSSAFDIEGGGTAAAFKKLFNDPMDCILGLSVVPVAVPTSGAREITIGNLVTTVSMNVASQQYVEVNCGSVNFTRRFFGSYLDFEPYTKMALFVPYSGVHAVNADDIIGRNVSLVYHIDILTGSLVAFLKCGDSVLYEFNGACASNIPVNSLNYASTIENAIRIAVNIGTTVATAGAAAPAAAAGETAVSAASIARGISLAGSTAEGAISMKPGIDRAGSLGGTTGLMGNQIPYFIITRPRLCKPANQDFFEGYPSFIQNTIGGLIGEGFTSFTDVIIAGQYLTDAECAELETILKGGVYL